METSPCHNSVAGHQIATNFCTCHDSTAVVPCTKFYCNHCIRIEVRVKRNFHPIWIAMEKPLVKRAPAGKKGDLINGFCFPQRHKHRGNIIIAFGNTTFHRHWYGEVQSAFWIKIKVILYIFATKDFNKSLQRHFSDESCGDLWLSAVMVAKVVKSEGLIRSDSDIREIILWSVSSYTHILWYVYFFYISSMLTKPCV